MGVLGRELAKGISNLKELYDQYTYTHTHRVTIEEAIKDSERDQAANKFGRNMGRKYPNCSCAEMMKGQLPKNMR